MADADSNGDGNIDLTEFCALLMGESSAPWVEMLDRRNKKATRQELEALFKEIDTDGSGCISKEEATLFFKSLNPE